MRKIWSSAKTLCSRGVERDRALEIGAERLFHDDPRSLGEIGLGQHLDRRQRGVRRHAHIVDAPALAVEGLLRLLDRSPERAGAGRHRHVVERLREAPARPPSGACGRGGSNAASRAMARKPSASIASSDTPMIRHFGMKPAVHEMKEARKQLLVREIAGRAEQDHDLRQLGADPDRHLRHSVLHPMQSAGEFPRSMRQKRDKASNRRPDDFTAAI